MNAYKSLKPDQIASMTKDTQELMETQKQLMSTLNTLKPLMQDGKEMMNTFQSYFGKGSPSSL
jgi:peptidoglycan hydrolase CwlO-like protein